MRRYVAILNPQADRGRAAALAASLERALSGRIQLELQQTAGRGEAASLAAAAARSGADAVIAIGGDGTVHEVANGLMALSSEVRPPLGVIPAGSGNDVAFALGIAKGVQRSVEILERAATRWIDVGAVRGSGGQCGYCINNVGTLLEGAINLASHRISWPRGAGLYFRAMLQTLLRRPPTAELKLLLDGAEIRRDAILLSIANGPRSGGKFMLMPEASLDDGRFNYVLAAPVGRLRLLWKVRGAISGNLLQAPWIERGTFATLTMESNLPLAVHIDGEPWLRPDEDVREIAITVVPRALRILSG